METKKVIMPAIVAVLTLVTLVVGATYAYFTISTTNSFGTRTATATAESVGSVALASGNNLSLTVYRKDMMAQTATSFYASGSSTAATLGTATVTGDGTYNCTYKINIYFAGTMLTALDSLTTKTGNVILQINGQDYDVYTNKAYNSSSNKLSIDGSMNGIKSGTTGKITGNLVFKRTTENQNALAGTTITANMDVTNFACTASA